MIGFAALSLAIAYSPPPTLDEVLDRVRRHYPKAIAAQLDRTVTDAKATEKRGAFDPIATLESNSQRYNSNATPGKDKSTLMSDGVIDVTLPSGIKLFAGHRMNLGDPKSPAVATGLIGETFVGVKVPLWRGLGVNEKAIALRQAEISRPLADEGIRIQLIEMLGRAGAAYWDWAAASRKRTIARSVTELAAVRAGQIERRVQAGETAAIEAIEANAEVKRRAANEAKSERELVRAALKLQTYLWDESGATTPPPVAVVDIESPATMESDPIAVAQKARPEPRAIAINRTIIDLSESLARNDRRPALDFVLSPGYDTGAGGIGPTIKAGIFLTAPLQTHGPDGRIAEARAKREKLDLDAKLVAQQIEIEVADAQSALQIARERLALVKEELALTEKLESGERIRYEKGEGTLFLLNQRERATAEVMAKLVEAHVDVRLAELALRVATGTILDGGVR